VIIDTEELLVGVIGTLLIECRGGERELRETCDVLGSLGVKA
jgi:hypothetical protein